MPGHWKKLLTRASSAPAKLAADSASGLRCATACKQHHIAQRTLLSMGSYVTVNCRQVVQSSRLCAQRCSLS